MFKLSSEASLDGAITVENKFIVEYMPYADGDYVKVYLYGLSLAARKNDSDDSTERLARRLDLDEATVNAAIDYWTDLGLMSRLGDDICYFSPRTARPKIKKYDVDKYREFNRQAQLYIAARQITPNEYNEYYALMEKLDIEPQAMVLIVKYCVDLKGDNVAASYILAVARNLAQDGYRSADEVGERLDEFGVYYNDLCSVLGVMGGKRPDHEAVQLYKKWRITYKYDFDTIYHVAQSIKRGGAAVLDAKLTGYREQGLTTVELIDKFEDDRKQMLKLAKSVNKALGLYYDNVDPEIITYIKPWINLGFDDGAILAAAEYCMKNDIKRLSDLDAVLRDFFANGITAEAQIRERINHENRFDEQIRQLFKLFGIKGAVRDIFRAYYSNWSENYKLPQEVIDYCASLAVGKANPFAYMNSIILGWHNAGITTLEKAKATTAVPPASSAQSPAPAIVYENRTAEELNSLFTVITEDDD